MDEWDRMIGGLRSGDSVVLGDFFRQYGPALERVAAGRIHPGLRRRVGPETIALSVCRTFMRRAADDQFTLEDDDSLWRLLCAITLTKVKEQTRFHLRQKRGVDRETDIDSLGEPPADTRPTPERAALFADEFNHLVDSLDEEERGILELRLSLQTHAQIANEIGCSERTVRRVLAGLRERFNAAFGSS